ncbi:hypothetical protein [Campylobacter sp. RM12651]|uniref:hypothetical protein n=1 Tax=Campylobacter sp. RM12651 TaxID=1660079 RepID=UPI001EFC2B3B|nr:hypothetical protein [Campylobacter sp. RM12651]ULO03777.1 hypothetical protein AVBRAN_1323 [Campylobacter sp. RM12651]
MIIDLNNLDEHSKKQISRLEQIKDIAVMEVALGGYNVMIWTDEVKEPKYVTIKDLDIIKEYILVYPIDPESCGDVDGYSFYSLAYFIKEFNEKIPNNKIVPFLKEKLKLYRFEDLENEYNYGLAIMVLCEDFIRIGHPLKEELENYKKHLKDEDNKWIKNNLKLF